MKSTLGFFCYLVIALIFVIGTVVFRLLPVTMPVASAKTVTMGVGVYWDKDCTNGVSSIEWKFNWLGAKEDKTVYVRNEGNSVVTLSLVTKNWNPVNASDYISLSWNYSGESISPNEALQTTLTLSISPNIKGITNYSFEIIIYIAVLPELRVRVEGTMVFRDPRTGEDIYVPYSFEGTPVEVTKYQNNLVSYYRDKGYIFLYQI